MDSICRLYTILVNYERSIPDAIIAGQYRWCHPDILSGRFPSQRTGRAELVVVFQIFLTKPDDSYSVDDFLADCRAEQVRPADLQELLALGEQHPELPEQMPLLALCRRPGPSRLVALGSLWKDGRGRYYAPCLASDDRRRFDHVDIFLLEGDWYDAAVIPLICEYL